MAYFINLIADSKKDNNSDLINFFKGNTLLDKKEKMPFLQDNFENHVKRNGMF